MSFRDFLRLPPFVRIMFVVMLWPAIWAGAGMVMALVTDMMRDWKRHDPVRGDHRVVLR